MYNGMIQTCNPVVSYKNIYTYSTHCIGGISCLLLLNQDFFLQTEHFLINMNENQSWQVRSFQSFAKMGFDWERGQKQHENGFHQNHKLSYLNHHNQQCKCAYSVWAVYLFPTKNYVCHKTCLNFKLVNLRSYGKDYLCYSSVITVAYWVL